jgi:hypothetical protein
MALPWRALDPRDKVRVRDGRMPRATEALLRYGLGFVFGRSPALWLQKMIQGIRYYAYRNQNHAEGE